MITRLLSSLIILATAFAHAQTKREIFAPFTEHWQGGFKVYSHEGELIN